MLYAGILIFQNMERNTADNIWRLNGEASYSIRKNQIRKKTLILKCKWDHSYNYKLLRI